MGLGKLYNKIALTSPRVEVMLRKFYWTNQKRLKRFNPNKTPKAEAITKNVKFEDVLKWIKAQGIGAGDLLIVHSSYATLECTGVQPEAVVEELLKLVGPTGTLCMPVIRKFKGEPKDAEILTKDLSELVCTYDVDNTKIISGLLPYFLMKTPGSEVSLFPFNPMCAVGPLAKDMMAKNLDGDLPSPHGKNSSWKFCLDHGAKVLFLGTDLEHHNTMTHVAEEAFGDWFWSDEEWYRVRKFNIVDREGSKQYKEVYERKPKWGMLHYAEINVNHDLKVDGIVKTDMIDGVIPMGYEDANTFVNYLRNKNKKGYPYF